MVEIHWDVFKMIQWSKTLALDHPESIFNSWSRIFQITGSTAFGSRSFASFKFPILGRSLSRFQETWLNPFSSTYLHLKDNHLISNTFNIYWAISKIILRIQNYDSGSSRITPYLKIQIFPEHGTTYIF